MAAHKLFHAIVIVGASVTGGCHDPEPRGETPVAPGPTEPVDESESENGDRLAGSEPETGDRLTESENGDRTSESENGDRTSESESDSAAASDSDTASAMATMTSMRRTAMSPLTTGDPDDPDDGMLLIL